MKIRSLGCRLALCALLLSFSHLAHAIPYFYEFHFDTFTHQGLTYEGGDFSFVTPDYVAKDELGSATLASPVTVLGLTFSSVGTGAYPFAGGWYSLMMPFPNIDSHAPVGTVMGLFVTVNANFFDTGFFDLPGGGRFDSPDGGYHFLIANGCSASCLQWDLVPTSGSVSITPIGVPEAGSLSLAALGLVALGWVHRRRALAGGPARRSRMTPGAAASG